MTALAVAAVVALIVVVLGLVYVIVYLLGAVLPAIGARPGGLPPLPRSRDQFARHGDDWHDDDVP